MKRKINGYISIFLALIALPVYSIAIVGTDLAKILALKNHLRLSGKIVADSGLSYYNKTLYDDFDIFALSKGDSVEDYIRSSLGDNFYCGEDDFYKLSLLDSHIDYRAALIRPEILEKQILAYMSLEGPKKISMGLINLIGAIKESQKYTPSLKSKMKYEKLYGKLEGNFDRLKALFLDYENVKDRLNERLPIQEEAYDFLRKETDKYRKNREILEFSEASGIGRDKDMLKKILDLKTYIEGSDRNFEAYLNRFSSVKEAFTALIQDKNLDADVLEAIKTIESYNISLIEKLDRDIEGVRKAYDTQYAVTKDLIAECRSVLEDLKKQVGYFRQDAQKLTSSLQAWKSDLDELEKSDYKTSMLNEYNISSLKLTEDNVRAVDEFLDKELEKLKGLENKENNIKSFKLLSLSRYKLYKYITGISKEKLDKDKSKEAKSTRKSLENFAKNQRSENVEQAYGKASSYIRQSLFEGLASDGDYFDINLDNMDANIKKYNMEEAGFYENLLIAGYIVDKFSTKISNKDFRGQVEYILYGNDDLNKNIRNANNWIFAIRFGLNTIYAFTDAKLSGQANGLALAIAGWTGFAVPIVKSLILTSMSLGESFMDINNLNEEKKVPIFKNRSNWNIYLENLPMILAGTFVSKLGNQIDDLYMKLENALDKGLDNLDREVEGFIKDTMEGFCDSVASSILAPLQSKIISIIDYPLDQVKNELNLFFNSLREGAGDDSIKNFLIDYVEANMLRGLEDRLASFKADYLNFEGYFTSLTSQVRDKIYGEYSSYSNQFRSQIKTYMQNKSGNAKKFIEDKVNKYLGNFKATNKLASKSGLGFSYKDYLILLAAIELSKSNRELIIERLACVLDYEMRLKEPEFHLENMYTGIRVDFMVKLNLSKILAIFNKDIYGDGIEAFYE